MAKITYIESNGTEHVVEVDTGISVMEGATANDVPGIWGDCGGACSCATCHVYVDAGWADKIDPRSEIEESMLEMATAEVDSIRSRLSCQITVRDDLDGLIIEIPPEQ